MLPEERAIPQSVKNACLSFFASSLVFALAAIYCYEHFKSALLMFTSICTYLSLSRAMKFNIGHFDMLCKMILCAGSFVAPLFCRLIVHHAFCLSLGYHYPCAAIAFITLLDQNLKLKAMGLDAEIDVREIGKLAGLLKRLFEYASSALPNKDY